MNQASSLINNASVHASAGSGKTYLLVSRVLRLLLLGVTPASILAITFTRKAASEMESRLMQRLYTLACCDDNELIKELEQLELQVTPALLDKARQLYEELLHEPRSVRATTFHAFCQDLLRRFPLEADVPAGFDLVDKTSALLDEAWQALMSEAASSPDGLVSSNLRQLYHHVSPSQARNLLERFVTYRSDWWAYTRQVGEPVEHAIQLLSQQLDSNEKNNPVDDGLKQFPFDELRQHVELLNMHPVKTHLDSLQEISLALDESLAVNQRLAHLTLAFFTQSNTPRSRKVTGTLKKKLGDDNAHTLVEQHEMFCEHITKLQQQYSAHNLIKLNRNWLVCGQRLLAHYQRIKSEQRLLDFTDLEWKTYQLLNQQESAPWIQYKLDERIEHLLIDEFQDTNPTQWHLVLPLLEEMATNTEQYRSIFLVGDAKQSIYRFRRANPQLFSQASDWLEQHLDAKRFPLNNSWRSSSAITDFVNTLFTSDALANRLTDFENHGTNKENLWGSVILLPLSCEPEQNDKARLTNALRNPLLEPRPESDNQRFLLEGRMIATIINDLIQKQEPVQDDHCVRPMQFSDIIILLKTRTHVRHYEQAFREAGIPYLGADRGTLLESLEVNDILKLLHWLITPYDNLALAGILRTPLFSLSDDDLLTISRQVKQAEGSDWYQALQFLAEQHKDASPFDRAYHLLSRWLQRAGHIPVHDLLDRIFSEANVIERYRSAFPEHLGNRVQANLTRFIELALEMDSGRYPSLTRFTSWIKELKQQREDAPDSPSEAGHDDRVRFMTIHGAKGLEAPVIFLADASYDAPSKNSNSVIVDWPADQLQPTCFMLASKTEFMPDFVAKKFADESENAQREDANLLYVAVTRARQHLYISGSRPRTGNALGWYGKVTRACKIDPEEMDDAIKLASAGKVSPVNQEESISTQNIEINTSGLNGPFKPRPGYREIAPSRTVSAHDSIETFADEDGRRRGIVIHAMLEQLCNNKNIAANQVAGSLGETITSDELASCWDEAKTVFHADHLKHIFDDSQYLHSYNELPIFYPETPQSTTLIHGFIDRLLINDTTITIIDYKTHQQANKDNLAILAAPYQQQMALYAEGIQRIWPDKQLEVALLFTHCATLYPIKV